MFITPPTRVPSSFYSHQCSFYFFLQSAIRYSSSTSVQFLQSAFISSSSTNHQFHFLILNQCSYLLHLPTVISSIILHFSVPSPKTVFILPLLTTSVQFLCSRSQCSVPHPEQLFIVFIPQLTTSVQFHCSCSWCSVTHSQPVIILLALATSFQIRGFMERCSSSSSDSVHSPSTNHQPPLLDSSCQLHCI